jgi:hypothetical protein
MSNGWIKLHRKLKKSPIYRESKAVHIWVECLLRASHEEREFYAKREKVSLKPGQFLMGKREMAKELGLSPSTVLYWIKRFEADRMIDLKRTAKGGIVTIKNWDEHQQVDRKVDQGRSKDGPGIDPNKNVKNYKNVKKGTADEKISSDPTPAEIAEEFFAKGEIYNHVLMGVIQKGNSQEAAQAELEKFIDYWTEPSKSGKTCRWKQQKTFEVRRRLSTWFRNAEKSSSRASPVSKYHQDRDKFFEIQKMQRESMIY